MSFVPTPYISIFEGVYEILVDVVACENDGVGIARLVEHLARLFAQVRKVAAVETDTERLVSLLFKSVEHFYRVGNAAAERIVSVH